MVQLVVLVLVALSLTQCSWSPAYDTRNSTDGTLSVKATDPVFACRLKNDLLQRLKAMKVNERTIIKIDAQLNQGDLAYHPNYYAMRSQARAHITLTVERPEQPTYTYAFSEVTSYVLDQNEGWLNTQAKDNANERLLARVLDVLMIELVSLTSSSPIAATPYKPA